MEFNIKNVTIKAIDGVQFDKILAWTISPTEGATIRYIYKDKERLISLESEEIEFELNTDV